MKTDTFFQRFKTNYFFGVKVTIWPLLLIDTIITLLLAKGLEGRVWDIDFAAGLFISFFVIIPYVLVTFVGIVTISVLTSINKTFSNNAAFLMGGLIGVIVGEIAIQVDNGLWLWDGFLSLPLIATAILLARAGLKINEQVNQVGVVKTPELQMAGWLGSIAFIGSIVIVFNKLNYWDYESIYYRLGHALSLSLSSAILMGFLIGFLSRKIPRPAFMKSPAWLRAEETIRCFFESVKRRVGKYPVPKLIAFLLLLFGIYSGIVFPVLAIPSGRELWRLRDDNLSDPILVNRVLLFIASKGERPNRCEYIYAVDKDTGEPVWSSEHITDQNCDAYGKTVFTGIIQLSAERDIVYVSSSWYSDDDEGELLYALNSATGELLWKVDGYVDYSYSGSSSLDHTTLETNYFYILDEAGTISAIENSTGMLVWKTEIPKANFYAGIIEYSNQIVYYYNSDTKLLSAYDARDGHHIWDATKKRAINQVFPFAQSIYLVSVSEKPKTSIVGLNATTGEFEWEMSIGQYCTWEEMNGNKIYIQTHDSEGSFENYRELESLVVVDKYVGEILWQFNTDYSHGEIEYLIQDNVVYVGTGDGYLFALDGDNGKTIWQTKSSGVPHYLHIEDGTLVVVFDENFVSGIDIQTGAQRWTLDIGPKTDYPYDDIIAGDGVIYIASSVNQRVYAIDIQTGAILWSWRHNTPEEDAYDLQVVDGDILYVDQYNRFLGVDWFFALKTRP